MGCAPSKDSVVDLNSNLEDDRPQSPNFISAKTDPIPVMNYNLPGSVAQQNRENMDQQIINQSEESLNISDRSGSTLSLSQDSQNTKHVAYEVPVDDMVEGGGGESLIKRHPPLRFRKLEDSQVEISQEMINMKQSMAEERRSAIMRNRVKSARTGSRAPSSRMRSSAHLVRQGGGEHTIETHTEAYTEAIM